MVTIEEEQIIWNLYKALGDVKCFYEKTDVVENNELYLLCCVLLNKIENNGVVEINKGE